MPMIEDGSSAVFSSRKRRSPVFPMRIGALKDAFARMRSIVSRQAPFVASFVRTQSEVVDALVAVPSYRVVDEFDPHSDAPEHFRYSWRAPFFDEILRASSRFPRSCCQGGFQGFPTIRALVLHGASSSFEIVFRDRLSRSTFEIDLDGRMIDERKALGHGGVALDRISTDWPSPFQVLRSLIT